METIELIIIKLLFYYLRTVGVGTSVGHGKDTGAGMLELEVLVLNIFNTELFVRSYLEFVSVDRFAASTVVVGEVTALKYESASIILVNCLPGT